MVDYRIIEKGDQVFLEEIDDNEKEIKQKEPETKELTLIKAKKDEELDNIEVIITYIQWGNRKTPHAIEIKEYRKDGLIVYSKLETINSIGRIVNNRLSIILNYLGVNKECKHYYESYRIIKSLLYGNYIIMALYGNGYIIYRDPESLGNFYYTIYKELIGGKLSKKEYLEITHVNIIDPYTEKDLALFSNIVDRIKQKVEIKTIKNEHAKSKTKIK